MRNEEVMAKNVWWYVYFRRMCMSCHAKPYPKKDSQETKQWNKYVAY